MASSSIVTCTGIGRQGGLHQSSQRKFGGEFQQLRERVFFRHQKKWGHSAHFRHPYEATRICTSEIANAHPTSPGKAGRSRAGGGWVWFQARLPSVVPLSIWDYTLRAKSYPSFQHSVVLGQSWRSPQMKQVLVHLPWDCTVAASLLGYWTGLGPKIHYTALKIIPMRFVCGTFAHSPWSLAAKHLSCTIGYLGFRHAGMLAHVWKAPCSQGGAKGKRAHCSGRLLQVADLWDSLVSPWLTQSFTKPCGRAHWCAMTKTYKLNNWSFLWA